MDLLLKIYLTFFQIFFKIFGLASNFHSLHKAFQETLILRVFISSKKVLLVVPSKMSFGCEELLPQEKKRRRIIHNTLPTTN